ncbi:DUF6544 family protein [Aquimarina algiphila]|uniref:DUF6544 family protein n=1 Tax=Aquimarina algiphila TaxID=2047982 RepID=UPI00232B82E8|nr:DUF6544 family protein [Aquimarina algiphila]
MIIGSIVLLLFLIGVAGISSFNSRVEKEKTALFNSKRGDQKITKNDLKNLPNLIKNHLIKTGVLGKPKYCNATFKQTGMIKTNPEKNWLSFTAIQYMSSNNPGFIWTAKALPMLIRDKYVNHRGEVKVSLLGLKNLILFTGQKVDQSSLGRYLGELIWFPMGFLDPDISWQTIDSKIIKATITKNNQVLDGLFIFNQNGMIDLFKTKRYRDIELENFIGEVGEYQDYDGLIIPNKMTAIWDSKEGKQEYFKADIKGYTLL